MGTRAPVLFIEISPAANSRATNLGAADQGSLVTWPSSRRRRRAMTTTPVSEKINSQAGSGTDVVNSTMSFPLPPADRLPCGTVRQNSLKNR